MRPWWAAPHRRTAPHEVCADDACAARRRRTPSRRLLHALPWALKLRDGPSHAAPPRLLACARVYTEKTRPSLTPGARSYEALKKSDLEAALDEFIAEHTTRFANRPDLTGYFNSRSKALGSPVKRERESLKDEAEKTLKGAKRRVTKAIEELTSEYASSTPV